MRQTSKPGPGYYLSFLLIGPLTYLAHELGHWAGGEAVGVDMWMTLNKAGAVDDSMPGRLEAIIIAASGPVVTLVIAVIAWQLATTRRSFIAYGVLYFQLMFRLVAGGITLAGNHPNDEAAVGVMLGIGAYPLTIAMSLLLLALTWDTARRLRPGLLANFAGYALSSLVITVFVFADSLMRGADIRLL
ncbi:hypothetical protein AWH62_14825 [Maricaulis sp. W15]|uniref:hypothetical protein n=1 Tax=Maricaulis sp. W15 TaxID=1772333 RepID=UPI000948AFF2|nr:hypothetical protein [Maricaulis sp. W15]OLF80620.1 hypothetical protein AWH62_14825 [Maricaulis sp. W15]